MSHLDIDGGYKAASTILNTNNVSFDLLIILHILLDPIRDELSEPRIFYVIVSADERVPILGDSALVPTLFVVQGIEMVKDSLRLGEVNVFVARGMNDMPSHGVRVCVEWISGGVPEFVRVAEGRFEIQFVVIGE